MSSIKRFTATKNKYFGAEWDEVEDVITLPDFIQGSGCFGRGTLVLTSNGYKAIDCLTLADKILAYDKFGELEFARIKTIKTHNKADFVDDIYLIETALGLVWPKGITGNHAVFDHATQVHKQILDFKVGDSLEGLHGSPIPITSITVIPHEDLSEEFAVYDLTVTPQHTFLCGTAAQWIKVHNSGGGKRAQNMSTGIEAPNTLQAASVAYVLDLISAGPIVGINGGVNTEEGIYFNNTLLQSAQGQQNFTGYVLISGYYTDVYPQVATTTGTPDQPVLAGFTDVETTIYSQNQPVPYNAPVTVAIIDTGKQACRVTLNFSNGLWEQYYSNGNIEGFSVNISINVKSISDATWSTAVQTSISGKTTSQYMVDFIIPAPAKSIADPSLGWSIQVCRNQPDDVISTTQATQSTFALFTVTEILYQQNSYPGMALVGLQVPAIAVNDSIPTRSYLVTGMIVQVPSNYDPVHRTYGGGASVGVFDISGTPVTYLGGKNATSAAGYWDGSFQWAWTDNPAWILYDIITNNKYGLGQYLGQSLPIDKYSFYEASLYNDCTQWNGASANTYTKTLIPNGSHSNLAITNVSVSGTASSPTIVGYVTAPGNFVSIGDSVTISGVTGALASLFNGTHGVLNNVNANIFTITIPSTNFASSYSGAGMAFLDNSTAGYEHRFACNVSLRTQQSAWNLIQAIAGNMHSIVTDIGGYITVVQDRPKAILRFFNTTNIVDGLFTYSSSEVTSRTTAINVTFNDKNNYFLPKTVSEWDITAVGMYGYISDDIVAFGVVDESQARRLARFALYTALEQPDICSFAIALNILDLQIGDVIATQDNYKVKPTSEYINGRVVGAYSVGDTVVNGTTANVTFVLDRAITISAASNTYQFGIIAPDGVNVLQPDGSNLLSSYIWAGDITAPLVDGATNTITVQFQDPNTGGVVHLPTASTGYINAEFMCYCSATGEYYDTWMVQSIAESSRGVYTLTCIEYNPNKYATVEDYLQFAPVPIPSGLLSKELPAPGLITFQPVFVNTPSLTGNYLLVSWAWNNTQTDQVSFNLKWQLNNGNWNTVIGLTVNNYEIDNAVPGMYNVIVSAVNLAGVISPISSNSYSFYQGVNTFTPITVNTGSILGNAFVVDTTISKGTSVSTPVNATALIAGHRYVIKTTGAVGAVQTDFTLVGASSNTAGTSFIAAGAGTGTGVANAVTNNISAWDTYAFNTVGYETAFAVQWNFTDNSSLIAVGLDAGISGTTDSHTAITNIQYAIYTNAGLIYVTESGVVSASYGSYAPTDVFEVAYTSTAVQYLKNGTVFRTTAVSGTPTLYFNSVFYTPGASITNVILGTYTTSALSDLQAPIHLYTLGTTGTTFTGQDLQIIWTENPGNLAAAVVSPAASGASGSTTLVLQSGGGAGIVSGDNVQGTGVPIGTLVQSVSGDTITLTQALTVTVTSGTKYTFNIPASTLSQYVVQVLSTSAVVIGTYVVQPNYDASGNPTGGYLDYTYLRNVSDHGTASRSVIVNVYAQDTLGHKSTTPVSATFTNAQAGTISTLSILPTLDGLIFTIAPNSVDADIGGYVICRGTTSGFTPSTANQIYNGKDASVTLPTPDNTTTYWYAAAEYDSFGQDSLSYSSNMGAISIGATAAIWSMTGVNFSLSGSTVSWTSGTINNAGAAYTISAGSATWTTGTLYIFFAPAISVTTLQSTNVTATAVSAGNYPLATYNSIYGLQGGDGKVMINGSEVVAATLSGSAIIAGSILAQALSTTTAVITATAQIANAIITNAHITGGISSTSWSPGTGGVYSGWNLDKGGNFTSYGSFNLYDASGNALFLAGGGFNWNNVVNVGGTGLPAVNATNGANFSTSYTLTPLALTLTNATVTGHTVTSSVTGNVGTASQTAGTGGWNSYVYSTQSYSTACACQFTVPSSSYYGMAGLSKSPSAPSPYNYSSLDFGFSFTAGTVLNIFEGGSNVYSGTYSAGDTLEVIYTGSQIIYLQNGVQVRAVSYTLSSGAFHFHFCPYQVGSQVTNVTLGSLVVNAANINGQINTSNITTYIAGAAIGNAQIGNAAVDTLELAGQAVTIPVSASFPSVGGILGYTAVATMTVVSGGYPATFFYSALGGGAALGGVFILVQVDGGTVFAQPAVQYLENKCQLQLNLTTGTHTITVLAYGSYYALTGTTGYTGTIGAANALYLETKR